MEYYHNRPERADVERIIRSVARRAGVPWPNLMHVQHDREVVALRERAWLRILRETGCSITGLADVWGCDRKSIQRAIQKAGSKLAAKNEGVRRKAAAKAKAEAQHAATVRFLYPDRAAAILSGKDPQTQADVARWNAIGRRSTA